jgi:hypothetical protein
MSGELPFWLAALITLGIAGGVAVIWAMAAMVWVDVVERWRGRGK